MTDQAQPAEQAGGDDVRADVLKAFEEHGIPTEQDWKLEGTEPEVASKEEAAVDTESKGDRSRDERGRFAKGQTQSETPKPDENREQKEVSGTDKSEEKPAQVSTPDGPPSGWPAEAKALWSQLSPAIQAAVIKREGEISNGGRQWSEEKRRYEEALSPVRAVSQRHGISEHEGIKRLVAASDFLERDPVSALKWLAQNYGVDLRQLAVAPQQARVDPLVQQLYQELNQLKTSLSTREQQEIHAEISSFAKDRPHFEEVRQYMGRLLETGAAESMDDAYEQAIWALPAVREKLLAERESNTRGERERVDRERVDKAKRGAVSISGSPSGTPANKAPEFGSVRDTVRWAWSQHAGQ